MLRYQMAIEVTIDARDKSKQRKLIFLQQDNIEYSGNINKLETILA